jgi:hypothetical protein
VTLEEIDERRRMRKMRRKNFTVSFTVIAFLAFTCWLAWEASR